VIAGAGTGIPVYRALQARGTPFATGVLHHGDIDYHIGTKLASEVFAAPAFAPIGRRELDRARERLQRCRAVVNALSTYGPGNAGNAELTAVAARLDIPVVTDVADLATLV
jgi:iron complex transport system ATP-binding protein